MDQALMKLFREGPCQNPAVPYSFENQSFCRPQPVRMRAAAVRNVFLQHRTRQNRIRQHGGKIGLPCAAPAVLVENKKGLKKGG